MLAAEAGHSEPWTGTGAYRQDTRTQDWLRAAGYRTDTTFTRMRIDFDQTTGSGRPTEPPATDVVVRQVTDEADLRIAHDIDEESFTRALRQRAGLVRVVAGAADRRGADFSQVYLAYVDDAPVGLLVSNRDFEQDDNAGYVRTLGVLPAGRGRGVGTALLRDYFARAQAEGRVGGAAARRRRERDQCAAALRVGGDARGPRDRRLGKGERVG